MVQCLEAKDLKVGGLHIELYKLQATGISRLQTTIKLATSTQQAVTSTRSPQEVAMDY